MYVCVYVGVGWGGVGCVFVCAHCWVRHEAKRCVCVWGGVGFLLYIHIASVGLHYKHRVQEEMATDVCNMWELAS